MEVVGSEAEEMMVAETQGRGGSHGEGVTEVEMSSEGRPRAMLARDQRRASVFKGIWVRPNYRG